LIDSEHVGARSTVGIIAWIISKGLARTSSQCIDRITGYYYSSFRIAGCDPVQLPGRRASHIFGAPSITNCGSNLITVAITAGCEFQGALVPLLRDQTQSVSREQETHPQGQNCGNCYFSIHRSPLL